jgi:hypothetical protein
MMADLAWGTATAPPHLARKPLCALACELTPVAVVKEHHSITSQCIDCRER